MAANSRGYQGATGASRKETRIFACSCGERFPVEVWRAVDVRADPEAGRDLLAGRLNHGRCPACGTEHEVSLSVLYHDPSGERLVLALPAAARHRELEERGRLYLKLAEDRASPPEYVREFDVVFGMAELAALVRPAEPAEGTVVMQLRPVAEPETPTPIEIVPLATREIPSSSPPPPPEKREKQEDTNRTRVRLAVPDTSSVAIDKWIGNREGVAAMLAEDRVLVCAALPASELDPLTTAPLDLRVQLHRLPTYPLVVITIVASSGDGKETVLHAPLDIARAAHRAVLDSLGRRGELTLHLYDADYLAVDARALSSPLEENAQRIAKAAKEALGRVAPEARSFEKARGAFLAPGFERLGRVHVALSEVELGALGSPCQLRQAVATVARWSEPGAETYLVEVRSFPLTRWRKVRTEVVRAAIEQGIHCPKALTQRVLAESNVSADWTAVLKRQVGVFTEVALRLRPNDLSADEEAENWRLLTAECQAAGVALDPQVERLARAADQRVRAVADGGADLRALPAPELIALLEQKDARREAALILCERHDAAGLPAIFVALRKMTRAEANRVLPAVTQYGEAAERALVDGLKSKKSFVRQGCALALGTIGGMLATESLARMLLEEPTEIWPEVARALGDLGAAAVMPAAMRLREADAEGRERIARALAHVLVKGVRGPVEMLAAGRDPLASVAARRAIELEDEVRRGESEVRGGDPPREQTVVRSFSRRFFDALGGAVELGDEDLEEIGESDLEEGDHAGEGHPPLAAESTLRHKRLPRERNS